MGINDEDDDVDVPFDRWCSSAGAIMVNGDKVYVWVSVDDGYW